MTKILVVDDHAVVRDGVKRMFDEQPGTVAFGEASTPHEAIKLVSEQDWDIVVLDLALGERSGLEVLQELKKLRPKLPVLILSMYAEEQYARRAFKAGASGYITKDMHARGVGRGHHSSAPWEKICQPYPRGISRYRPRKRYSPSTA